MSAPVAVLGGGSWGTALAKVLADHPRLVRLWMRDPAAARDFNEHHENRKYLPGVKYPDNLVATHSLSEALDGVCAIVAVVPSHGMREALTEVARVMRPGTPVVSASKGIEQSSLCMMSDILLEVLPVESRAKLAFLGGPSFAKEVVGGLPTAVSVASLNPALATEIQALFATERFRVYTTD